MCSGGSKPGAAAGPPGTRALDRSAVCLHCARKLLRGRRPGADASVAASEEADAAAAAAGQWRRSEFLAAWAAAVPEEWAPPPAALLAGEALEELPEGALPGAWAGKARAGGPAGGSWPGTAARVVLPLHLER